MPDIDETPIVESKIETLEREIKELEATMKKSRNTVEKALCADSIAAKRNEITKIKYPDQEKNILTQKEAPVIMDKKDTKRITSGSIINNGSSFITLF